MKSIFSLIFICSILSLQAQKFSTIDNAALAVNYSTDYKAAAQQLAAPYQDDVSKVRAIFTWIAKNIAYDMDKKELFVENRNGRQKRITANSQAELDQIKQDRILDAIMTTLEKKKGVCQDYAWIFQAMLEEIGIESEFVSGFARFSPSNIGKVHKRGNHAWNVAKIDGAWALFDVTWSTGMGQNQNLGDGFFMIDPEIFILSHHPTDPQWQLLETPIDAKAFSNLPFMHAAYLSNNVISYSPTAGKVSRKEIFTIELELGPGKELILFKGKRRSPNTFTKNGNVYSIDFSKTKLRGEVHVSILEARKISPLLTFKVTH